MMGVGPEESGRMDLWTYQALMWNWNRAHDPEPQERSAAGEITADIDRLSRFHRAHALH